MRVLEVKGKEASEFLHRVCASQVNKLSVGQGNRGLLLNGQSKMIAQFDLLRLTKDQFYLVAPEGCFAELVAELERLHFAEEFEQKEVADSYRIVPGESQGELEYSVNDRWPSVVPGFVVEKGEGELGEDFHSARIRALVPWPKKDWDASTNALEAGTLPWIDRYKGCYPGQEVVEKSLNLGHPARVLIAVEMSGNEYADGVITSFISGNPNLALVRVPWKNRGLPVAGSKIIKSHF